MQFYVLFYLVSVLEFAYEHSLKRGNENVPFVASEQRKLSILFGNFFFLILLLYGFFFEKTCKRNCLRKNGFLM